MNTLSPATQLSQKRETRTTTRSSSRWPWLMLFSRTVLFVGIQSLFALGYYLAGSGKAWDGGAAWWPFAVTITNVIVLVALTSLFRAEGKRYWDIFRIRRENVKSDLLALLSVLVLGGPLGYFPNVILAGWLFSDSGQALDLLVRPLPLWAAFAGLILFPITQGMVEIPTYFSYVMPRIESRGLPRWLAVAIPALMLGLQHLAAPFLFNFRFITWRALMYLPFAILVGIVIRWRPRLLPYIAIVHVLMDLSFATMFLSATY